MVVSAAPGDAITNAALDLRASLRGAGITSELFGASVDPALESEAHLLADFARLAGGADLLVLHASIGEPLVSAFLAGRDEALAIIYHNISPASSFQAWVPEFATLLSEGRRELRTLAGRTRLAVGVSRFNAAELVEMGFDPVVVIPLVVDPAALVATEPDPEMVAWLEGFVGPMILSVGQLLPHKRVDWALMAFHLLVSHLIPEANFVVVGADRLRGYGSGIRRLVARFNLNRVYMVGTLSQEALVACFRRATVYFSASEHEGFCLPLLEAMAFDVPVLARSFAAIPETLGGAGLCLAPDDGLEVAAEALRAMSEDAGLRATLVALGRDRLAQMSAPAARSAMVEALLGAAAGAS